MTWALVLVPAVTAALTLGARRQRSAALSVLTAVLGSLATLVVAVVAALAPEATRALTEHDPFADAAARPVPGGGYEMGDLALPLATSLSATSAVLALVVALVVLAVQLYSVWYLADDDRRAPFHATVSLFAAAMLLVVVSSDLVLTLVGWEVMGWCSYLLIGHWSRRPEPRRAAHKAFLVTRVADIGLVLGVTLLVAEAGSSARADVIAAWTGDATSPALRSLALVLVVVGVLGKSAQVPFQDWLPDAMEGPTPASALIHAATMVAAGTVVLAQLLPLLALAGPARLLLGASVAVTMVLAAVLALLQPDLKRLLAWSTVSQVALMLAPLAVAGTGVAAGAALFHLYAHAIFKALLFLALGWLAATRGGTAAALLGGSARQHVVALAAWGIGLAALAGIPVLVGGMSKEHVVAALLDDGTATGAWLVLGATLVTVVLTAAYATRALLVALVGGDAGRVRQVAVMPTGVAVVLVALTVLSLVGGLVISDGALPDTGNVGIGVFLLVLLLVVLGIAIGAVVTRTGALDRAVDGRAGRLAAQGVHADAAYRGAVARPVGALARLVRFVDGEVVETYVRGSGWGALGAAAAGDSAHRSGRPTTGLVLVGVGALVVIGLGVLL